MNPGLRCCPPCGTCFTGQDGETEGCCYRLGDVIRLTFEQKADQNGTIYNSINSCGSGPTGPQCCDPADPTNCTTLQRCCYEVTCQDADPRWVEYECVAVPASAKLQRAHNGECYCHPYYEFELNGNQSDNMPEGTGCNYPLRFRYLCSGCRKIDDACGVPGDFRPESELPCGYLLPSGDYYEAATPAAGWEWDCAPTCNLPDCVNCLIGADDCSCADLGGTGFFAGPSCNVCIKACNIGTGTFDPNCGTAVQVNCGNCADEVHRDLTSCDGALWCCYRYKCVHVDYDCAEPGEGTCTFDHLSTIKLERVGNLNCVWDYDRWRCCNGVDTSQPDVGTCPGSYPGPGDSEREECN